MAFPTNPINNQEYITPLGTVYKYNSTDARWNLSSTTLTGATGAQGHTGAQGYTGASITGLPGPTGALGLARYELLAFAYDRSGYWGYGQGLPLDDPYIIAPTGMNLGRGTVQKIPFNNITYEVSAQPLDHNNATGHIGFDINTHEFYAPYEGRYNITSNVTLTSRNGFEGSYYPPDYWTNSSGGSIPTHEGYIEIYVQNPFIDRLKENRQFTKNFRKYINKSSLSYTGHFTKTFEISADVSLLEGQAVRFHAKLGPSNYTGTTLNFAKIEYCDIIPGQTGSSGDSGFWGTTGINYNTYLSIHLIEQGLRGNTGLAGPTGAQGHTGFGIQGQTGVQGRTGIQGVTGLGFTGLQGQTGIQGRTGIQGVTGLGFTGLQGFTGIQGRTGIQGITGAVGVTGAFGGPQGETGLQGDTGIQGNTGSQGITGVFYDIEVWKRYTGPLVGFTGAFTSDNDYRYYKKIGNTIFISASVLGQDSFGPVSSFSLPFTGSFFGIGIGIPAVIGTYTGGAFFSHPTPGRINCSGSTAEVYVDFSGKTFPYTGLRYVGCQFFYEEA